MPGKCSDKQRGRHLQVRLREQIGARAERLADLDERRAQAREQVAQLPRSQPLVCLQSAGRIVLAQSACVERGALCFAALALLQTQGLAAEVALADVQHGVAQAARPLSHAVRAHA